MIYALHILFSLLAVGLFVSLIIIFFVRLAQDKPVRALIRSFVRLILCVLGLLFWLTDMIFAPMGVFGFFTGLVLIGIGLYMFLGPLLRSKAEKRKPLEEIQQKQQARVDDKVDEVVERFYERYGEEWINEAGRSRLTMAIDEMLEAAPSRNSNAARTQRTLAAAVLETVLARKMEEVRQQQGTRQTGSAEGS